MKMQHVGVFWTIRGENLTGNQVTTKSLQELTGIQRNTLLAITSALVDLKLLAREKVAPEAGKGRKAYSFTVTIPEEIIHEALMQHLRNRKT